VALFAVFSTFIEASFVSQGASLLWGVSVRSSLFWSFFLLGAEYYGLCFFWLCLRPYKTLVRLLRAQGKVKYLIRLLSEWRDFQDDQNKLDEQNKQNGLDNAFWSEALRNEEMAQKAVCVILEIAQERETDSTAYSTLYKKCENLDVGEEDTRTAALRLILASPGMGGVEHVEAKAAGGGADESSLPCPALAASATLNNLFLRGTPLAPATRTSDQGTSSLHMRTCR